MPAPFQQIPFELLPEKPRIPHPFFELPSRRVQVWTEAFGDTETTVRVFGSGPPLLLIHGLMTTAYSWRYVIEPLGRHFTVYAPDLLGSGAASAPRAPLTPEAMADWLDALQQAVGARGGAVLANSMGGYLAMWWALRYPVSIKRLVVVHAPAVPMPRLCALWPAIRAPGARAALTALVRRSPERWVHRNVHYYDESLKSVEEAREYARPLHTDDGMLGFYRQLRDGMDVRAMRRFWRALQSRAEERASFPVPLQLVYARQDPMVPPSVGRRLAEVLPDADQVWLGHASHFAHVDAVDAFLPPVLRFLGVRG